MAEQLALLPHVTEISRKFKVTGKVQSVFNTASVDRFQTHPVGVLELGFEGVPGDRHAGFTRRSGGREPWYPRGTEMCNERQVSILSVEELDLAANRMEIAEIRAEWIGGNILLSGIAQLSMVPPRTRLEFSGGVVIRVDGDNSPCRFSGAAVAANYPEREGLDLLFAQKARRLRGLVGIVEIPGGIAPGEEVTAHIPEQWIYRKS